MTNKIDPIKFMNINITRKNDFSFISGKNGRLGDVSVIYVETVQILPY